MGKNQIIRTIYDLLSLAIICSVGYLLYIQSGQFYSSGEYEITTNDTILLNRYRSEQLIRVNGSIDNFSYIDAKGNEISADDYDYYLNQINSKYPTGVRSSHLDSLKINTLPHVVIKKAKVEIDFRFKGNKPFCYYIGVTYFVIFLLLAISAFLLIRRILNLTISRNIYSKKGVGVFKNLFILSIVYCIIKISYKPIYLYFDEGIMIHTINKSQNISEIISLRFNFYELFIHLSLIVITFSIYQAFKYGYEVKTENDLTI